jgi:hypothetical protein
MNMNCYCVSVNWNQMTGMILHVLFCLLYPSIGIDMHRIGAGITPEQAGRCCVKI